jgi:fermentation-respiration switch protein FrsA (DUF1100 family)
VTTVEEVRIPVDGLELAGHVHRPAATPDGGAPGVVLTGPFTGVKDQVVGAYAALLAERGFVALAFDHRNFGDSGGGTRGREDAGGKLADLRAAVGSLAARPDVRADAVAAVGVCLGAGYALRAAAADPRVRAVACVAGAYNDPVTFARDMGLSAYRQALAGFLDPPGTPPRRMPAVAPHGPAAMSGPEPWEYYGTDRAASTSWRNEVTVDSLHQLMTFDALGAADLLGDTPLLVVHGRADAYCPPSGAQAAYDRTPGRRELLWLDAERHIDLYDDPRYVVPAADAVAGFLHGALG